MRNTSSGNSASFAACSQTCTRSKFVLGVCRIVSIHFIQICPNLRGRCTVSSIENLEDFEGIVEAAELNLLQPVSGSNLSKSMLSLNHLKTLSIQGPLATLSFGKSTEILEELDIYRGINPRQLLNLLKFTPNLAKLTAAYCGKIEEENMFMFDGVSVLVPKLEEERLQEGLKYPYYDDEDRKLSDDVSFERKRLYSKLVKAFAACRYLSRLHLTLDSALVTEEEFRTACLRNTCCTLSAKEEKKWTHSTLGRFE